MAHTINFKTVPSKELRQFQEFIFIGDTSIKSIGFEDNQLHDYPDSEPLSTICTGKFVLITKILITKDDIVHQLHNSLIKPGQAVDLVSKTGNGSVIVNLGGKLIGLGAEIAQKIIVKEASQKRK